VLGEDEGIDSETVVSFRRAGLSHLLRWSQAARTTGLAPKPFPNAGKPRIGIVPTEAVSTADMSRRGSSRVLLGMDLGNTHPVPDTPCRLEALGALRRVARRRRASWRSSARR
jgi:hypothetical protein